MARILHEKRLKNGLEMPIEVYDMNTSRNTDKPTSTLHCHGHIEFLFADGNCDVECLTAYGSVALKAGDMLVVNSFVPHTYIKKLPKNKYICVKAMPQVLYSFGYPYFDICYCEPFFKNSTFKYLHIGADTLKGTGVSDDFFALLEERKGKRYGYELAMKSHILDIFLYAVRYACDMGIYKSDKSKIQNTSNERLIYKSLEHINSDYADISERQAAAAVNMSYSHYSRQFKSVMGVSFKEYLANVRLSEAEKLLITTDMSVTETALACGFGTCSYFIETFKKSRGMTPGDYRKIYAQKVE